MSPDIAKLAQEYRDSLESLREARTALSGALKQEKANGTPVPELMEQTGYSRPRIYQLLEGK